MVGRDCTLPSMDASDARNDAERRKTLLTLIGLAKGSSPADCWDDGRAEDLLRSQSNPDEVRELGMSEEMIARVWGVGGGEREQSTTNANAISHTQHPTPHSPETEKSTANTNAI